jgi:hypothetical protein
MQRQNGLSDLEGRASGDSLFDAMFTPSEIDLAQNSKLAPATSQSQATRGFGRGISASSHLPPPSLISKEQRFSSQTTHSTSFAGFCFMGGWWYL